MGDAVVDDTGAEFRDFVAASAGPLLRTAFLLTGDHQLAEDLTQTALLRTYEHWTDLRHPEAARAYARRALVTANISWWRRSRRWAEIPDSGLSLETPVADGAQARAETAVIRQLLSTLPRRQRAAIVLRFYEGLTERETAEVMGCAVGTIKSQVHDALASLRRALLDAEAQPDAEDVVEGGTR